MIVYILPVLIVAIIDVLLMNILMRYKNNDTRVKLIGSFFLGALSILLIVFITIWKNLPK